MKNGKRLTPVGITKRTSSTGYRSEITVYECEHCSNCLCKSKCTRAQVNRRMQVSKKFVEKRQISYANITSYEGIISRMNRSIQVEDAFGVLKNYYQFNRFLTRGAKNLLYSVLGITSINCTIKYKPIDLDNHCIKLKKLRKKLIFSDYLLKCGKKR